MNNAKELYTNVLCAWGVDAQLDMVIEECSELINAIEKFRRGRNTSADVATEIADVMIMAEQAALIFGPELVEGEKARKLERLEQRLNSYKEHGVEKSKPGPVQ